MSQDQDVYEVTKEEHHQPEDKLKLDNVLVILPYYQSYPQSNEMDGYDEYNDMPKTGVI